MNQTITLGEAILVSAATVLIWAFVQTVLQMIEENVKNKEKRSDKRLWYGDESPEEVKRMYRDIK